MDSVKVILDDNINISGDRAKLIRVGGVQTTYNNPQNNGSILGGQILFNNILLPSLANSVISRNMRIRYRVQVSCNGQTFLSGAGQLRLTNPNVVANSRIFPVDPPTMLATYALGALRAFPLSSCTDTATLTINSVPTSLYLRQVLPAILRTVPKSYLEREASECPSMLDNGPVLSPDDITTNEDQPSFLQSSQPLSNALNCPYATSRASFMPVSYVYGGAGGLDVAIYEVCEPIFVAPLSLYDDKTFLANVNSLSYQVNYSLLNDMFAYYQIYPNGFKVSLIDNSAKFEYTIITLDPRVVAIPRVVSYDYSVPQFYQTNLQPLAYNPYTSPVGVQNTGLVYSQSLRLSYMPSLIYIYVHLPINIRALSIGSNSASQTDCNLALGTASGIPSGFVVGAGLIYNTDQTNIINIELNNRQGLLSGASIKDLFRIACSNGYCYSYNQWLMNPIVIINPIKDLGLDLSASDIYPNQNGNVTLSVSGIFNTWNFVSSAMMFSYNPGGIDTAFRELELAVVCLQDGICEISPDTTIYNSNALSSQEVKASIETAASGGSLESDFVPSSVAKTSGGSLSSMFGSAPSVISGIAKGLGSVIEDPLFKMALKGAQSLGGGVSGGKVRRARKDKKDGGFLFGLL